MTAVVEASLDNLRSDDVRFLEVAARYGPLRVRVPSDQLVERLTGGGPSFPVAERLFLAQSMRWVASAAIVERPMVDDLALLAAERAIVVTRVEDASGALEAAARDHGVAVRMVSAREREGFPPIDRDPSPLGSSGKRPRVVVTGCYDWLHSGHIRFFMDAAAYGALYVVVGSDANVEFLKGPGHPLQREEERRYMVGSVGSVQRCLVSSGSGWMDAEPEIADVRPAFYIVNDDGDRPDKRKFCASRGIEYVVLERRPHAGLPARSSTELRGF